MLCFRCLCHVLVNIYSTKIIYLALSICVFFTVICTLPLDVLLLVNSIKFDLFKFNDNMLVLNQSLTLFNSLLIFLCSSFKSYVEHIMLVSSANNGR